MLAGVKLSTAVEQFIAESGSCNTPSSRTSTRNRLGLLGRTFPGLQLDQFTTAHLTQFCTMNSPAPGTVKARKSVVRSFFEWVTYMKLLDVNPAADLKFTVRPSNQGVRHHNWLSEEEIAHVLRCCPSDLQGRRAKLVLMVGFMVGLRRHEIADLRWSSFSHDYSRLSLKGKGGKMAQLGVPPQLRTELHEWRRLCPVGLQTIFPQFALNRFEEIHPLWDKPIGEGTICDIVEDAGKLAGIPALRPHDLRRTFAGVLEAKGVPVTDISRLLRHSNVGITSTYLEKNPNKTSALADTFELAL